MCANRKRALARTPTVIPVAEGGHLGDFGEEPSVLRDGLPDLAEGASYFVDPFPSLFPFDARHFWRSLVFPVL